MRFIFVLLGVMCLCPVVSAFNASLVDVNANITPTDLYNRTSDVYVSMIAESKEEVAESTSGLIAVYVFVGLLALVVILVKLMVDR